MNDSNPYRRKMIGIMAMCWSVFWGYLIGNFVVGYLWKGPISTYVTTALVFALTCWWITQIYWKQD